MEINNSTLSRAAALTALLISGGATGLFADDLVVDDSPPKVLPKLEVTEDKADTLSAPKFNTPLLDTPQIITIIPKAIIEQQGATSVRDVLRNTPGITFTAGEGGTPAGDQMTIRGYSARTDMYIDGVRDLGGYARDAFNLEQVEVAKGPSSSTAGRGSTGGSVNLVSKTPYAKTGREVTVAAGTDNYLRATADVNQPLGDNQAIRVNLMRTDADVPGRDVVNNSSWGVAPAYTLGLAKPTKLTLAYEHLQQDNIPDYGLPRQVYTYDPPVSYSNWYGLKARDYEKINQDLATAIVEHKSIAGWSLRNLTRYGRTYRDSVITAPRFATGSTTLIRRSDWKSRDQIDEVLANQTQLNLDMMTGSINHAISAGLELTDEQETNYTRVEAPATILPDTDVYHPNPDDPYNGHIARNGAYNQGKTNTVSLYLFDNIFAGQRWQATAGLRYDRSDADYKAVAVDGSFTPLSRRDSQVSGRLGFVFKPTTNSSIYAGYANSFNPSGEGLSLSTSTVNLAPEKTDSYEIGTKWDGLNDRLSLTLALFRTEKTNARTPGIDPNDPPTVLAGKERVDGIEVSLAGHVSPAWEVFSGLALMNSKILASNTAGLDGEEFGLTPKTTFNLWTTYKLPFGLTLGGGAQYMDSVFRNTAVNADSIPAYWLFNAMVSCAVTERLSLQLNGTNLADKAYIDRVGGGHHIPGQARQFILSARYHF